MSLVFDVLNAITGTNKEPAGHNMPRDCRTVLIHMANRAGRDGVYRFGLALLAQDGDLGESTVRKCIADLLARGWLQDAGWSGPRNNATRCFAVRFSGDAWPVSTAHARLPPSRRGTEVSRHRRAVPRAPVADHPGPPSGGDAERSAPPSQITPGPRPAVGRATVARCPAPPSDGDYPPIYPPIYPLRDPPNIPAPISDPSLPLFGGLAAEPPKSEVQKKPTKGGGEKKPKQADRYAAAYCKAHEDAGFPVTALNEAAKRHLGVVAATHAKYRDGTPITGDALVQWFYRRGRAFRIDVIDPSRHRGGASPWGFGAWLDNGADGEERPLAPGAVEPPEPEEELEAEPYVFRSTPEERAPYLAKLRRMFPQKGAANG